MIPINTHTLELSGTSCEIGRALARTAAAQPALHAAHTGGLEGFGPAQAAEAAALFQRWCPGLADELLCFAEELHVLPEQVCYAAMTYLRPRCGQIALLPGATKEGKPLLARSYEFNHEFEDFCLVRTSIPGKYTHMGTSVLLFGRDDGFNEHGLAVTMSSCGFPVGAMPYMRAPKLAGLQYWAVIRALLENCRDVDDALHYLTGMPIAYNLNMILMDKAGNAALYETLDGRAAVKRLGADTPEQMLCATNHAVLPELSRVEPQALVHSLERYRAMQERFGGKTGVEREELKTFLLEGYPNGLCCHYYREFFGTTKSMVISPADGTIELCWGGRAENGWDCYSISKPLQSASYEKQLCAETPEQSIFGWQPTA